MEKVVWGFMLALVFLVPRAEELVAAVERLFILDFFFEVKPGHQICTAFQFCSFQLHCAHPWTCFPGSASFPLHQFTFSRVSLLFIIVIIPYNIMIVPHSCTTVWLAVSQLIIFLFPVLCAVQCLAWWHIHGNKGGAHGLAGQAV